MHARSWLLGSLAVLTAIPAPGCGLFRRRRGGETNVATSVSVAQTGRDINTLTRDEYEVLSTTSADAKATRWFFLSFPVGGQTSADEVEENAYYSAVGKVSGCDALLMAHPKHRRVIVPLLIVNVVRYEASIRGRCVALKDDLQLEGQAPSTREATKLEASAPVQPAAVVPAAPSAPPPAE
ncbi:MAG: hypothetical protein ACE37F_00020 [Nannocystaceae bacterium]|nr:hypothetical protein [bacterium]